MCLVYNNVLGTLALISIFFPIILSFLFFQASYVSIENFSAGSGLTGSVNNYYHNRNNYPPSVAARQTGNHRRRRHLLSPDNCHSCNDSSSSSSSSSSSRKTRLIFSLPSRAFSTGRSCVWRKEDWRAEFSRFLEEKYFQRKSTTKDPLQVRRNGREKSPAELAYPVYASVSGVHQGKVYKCVWVRMVVFIIFV